MLAATLILRLGCTVLHINFLRLHSSIFAVYCLSTGFFMLQLTGQLKHFSFFTVTCIGVISYI